MRGIMFSSAIVAVIVCAGLWGCSSGPKDRLTSPRVIVAPYDTSRGEVLFAFAPLNNESGVSTLDAEMITDKLVAAAEEIRGVRAVPLNRTLQAMSAAGLRRLSSPAEAKQLAQAMGVDAIIVGSITSYDPYTPVLGLTLAMFARNGSLAGAGPQSVDPRAITASATDRALPGTRFEDAPTAVVSENLDAKNHQVLLDVQAFAQGRVRESSALGWRRYTASFPLYCEFAGFMMMEELMSQEWVRVGRGTAPNAAQAQAQVSTDGR